MPCAEKVREFGAVGPNEWPRGSVFSRAADFVVAALASIPAGAAYVLIQLLMRVLPQRSPPRSWLADDEVAAPEATGGRRRLVAGAFLMKCYRRSLLDKVLHRNGSHCCFLPSCSEYAVRAVEKYGVCRGLVLATDRFRRCRPEAQGSYVDFP
jgi:putative component of membrane protein insertase Oxa1/YidC/SpoIIIJ protein YidD